MQNLARRSAEEEFSFNLVPKWGNTDCFAWKRIDAPVERSTRVRFPDQQARAEMQELLIALALDPKAAPTSSAWWSEFDHPDFRILARHSGGSMGQKDDGPEQHIAVVLAPSTHALVDKYLATSAKFRNKCYAALSGLHLFRRIHSPSSRAIELCIGFEAILGGGENNEIIHKVSTRGAIVLETTWEAREAVQKQLKALYTLRSKAVHGDISAKADADWATVNAGADLALRLYRLAVNHGDELPLRRLDLMATYEAPPSVDSSDAAASPASPDSPRLLDG